MGEWEKAEDLGDVHYEGRLLHSCLRALSVAWLHWMSGQILDCGGMQRFQITKRVPSKRCKELDSIQIVFLKGTEGPLFDLGRGGAGGGAG